MTLQLQTTVEVTITVEEKNHGAYWRLRNHCTFTTTDDCGNYLSYSDDYNCRHDCTSTYYPADYTAECSDEHPMDDATATDNCGDVTITVEERTTLALVLATT